MTYLYVVLVDGTWLKVTIVGKLASTSKRLTNPNTTQNGTVNSFGFDGVDEMGTWGSSDPAKVGMTTLGSLLEIGGFLSFVYSEVPLNFSGQQKQIVEVTVEATPAEKTYFQKQLEGMRRRHR